MMNVPSLSSAFPLNANGRHVLPLPPRIVMPELLPTLPGVQSPMSAPSMTYPLMPKVRLDSTIWLTEFLC